MVASICYLWRIPNELSKKNNVRAISIEVKAPDLQVTNTTAPAQAYAGAQIEVVWIVNNQVNNSILAQWYDSVYLSDDATLSSSTDTLLKDAQIQNLSQHK